MHLCAATLFYILRHPRFSVPRTNQSQCFHDLFAIIDSSMGYVKNVKDIEHIAKACKAGRNVTCKDYLRLGSKYDLAKFAMLLNEAQDGAELPKPVKEMRRFLKAYVLADKQKELMDAILELMSQDQLIMDADQRRELYLYKGGKLVSEDFYAFLSLYEKPDEKKAKKLNLELDMDWFMLGVLRYVYQYFVTDFRIDFDGNYGDVGSYNPAINDAAVAESEAQIAAWGQEFELGITAGKHYPAYTLVSGAIAEQAGAARTAAASGQTAKGQGASDRVIEDASADRPFLTYVQKLYQKNKEKKARIIDRKQDFESFYVQNDLALHTQDARYTADGELEDDYEDDYYDDYGYDDFELSEDSIEEAGPVVDDQEKDSPETEEMADTEDAEKESLCVTDFPNICNLIIGNGGLGKSMMMHHFLLDTAKKYIEDKWDYVPIFLSLYKYQPGKMTLEEMLAKAVMKYDRQAQDKDIQHLLAKGEAVVLLDGLDEVSAENLTDLMDELEDLIIEYPNCYYLMSSRMIPIIGEMEDFDLYDLLPLNRSQAIQLIEKWDDSYTNEEIKQAFIQDLTNDRFHLDRARSEEFIGNPLLLTMLYLTYQSDPAMPEEKHLFYERIYEEMESRHGAITGPGQVNVFPSGLSSKELKDAFAAFSAASYLDGCYAFTKDTFRKYVKRACPEKLQLADLMLRDFTEKLCLMIKDGTEYVFIHRSFQEYLAAYHVITILEECKKGERDKEEAVKIYEQIKAAERLVHGDEFFSLMMEMDAEGLVREYLFRPYLEEITDYKSFLRRFYPSLELDSGDDVYQDHPDRGIYCQLLKEDEIKKHIYEKYPVYYMRYRGIGHTSKVDENYMLENLVLTKNLVIKEETALRLWEIMYPEHVLDEDDSYDYRFYLPVGQLDENAREWDILTEEDFSAHIIYEGIKKLTESVKKSVL